MPLDSLARQAILDELSQDDDWEKAKSARAMIFYAPYPKQKEFHRASATHAETCLGAGNQLGKTLAASMACAYHATGLYPEWWDGVRYDKETVGWVGGDTAETIRDTSQKLLVGRIQTLDGLGTGSIPKDCIVKAVNARGIPDALDHVKVKHVSGGMSLIFFKSYEKGRKKWQGETIDWVWFDEEPPADIYSEGKTRTNKGQKGQRVMLTYTPLLGMSDLTHGFYQKPRSSQHLTIMTIEDVGHYSREEKDAIIDGYPEHEREARANGIPTIGSGRVFPIDEKTLIVDPFTVPMHWYRLIGCDFGWAHPQAWVSLMWDKDNDVIYVGQEYRVKERTPEEAAITIKKWHRGSNPDSSQNWPIPVAWPHDGHDKRKTGIELQAQYKSAGLNMLSTHATHPKGGYSTEAGIMMLLDRMKTGRLKVFAPCSQWLEEFRMYHRKDGEIVKERDDLMSATRIGCMMIRKAEQHDPYWGEPDPYDNDRPRNTGPMGY